MRVAFVAIVGRPSAGKSSLINRICGHKVSIVSPVPQTTRNRVRGILNAPEGQLVFLDTPGFHLSEQKMNQELKRVALASLDEVDLVLYVADVTREPGEEETMIADAVVAAPQPAVVAINKTDLLAPGPEPEDGAPVQGAVPDAWVAFLDARFPEAPRVETSAATGRGVEALTSALFAKAPEGAPFYPEEFYTDQDPGFRISETIREQVMRRTTQEVPHAVYVDILDSAFEDIRSAKGGSPKAEPRPQRLAVRAAIYVERESQKGIVVGKGGAMIRDIRKGAEQTLRELFPYPVSLDLRVKVNPKWRKKDAVLRRLLR
ncbi:MAG: GTPase Era [Spirochaetaceae bacterium]